MTSKNIVYIDDSLKNVVSNLGTIRDKNYYSEFAIEAYDSQQLETQYVSDWMSGQIVDVPANDMTRNWRSFTAPDLEAKQITRLEKAEKKLRTKKAFNTAQKWARLYGGSVIVMYTKTGLPEQPLMLNTIKQGDLKYLKVFSRREIQIVEMDQDVESENYQQPLYYQVNGSSRKIHYSRILHFKGVEVPWNLKIQNEYWDYSILQRVNNAIRNSATISAAIASMTHEATVDIISVPQLFEKLGQPGGKETLRNRFNEGALMKSINNILLLDSKEEYNRIQTSFSGLPDLLFKYIAVVSAAADIPATRLLGQSPQGLNATGESDSENYFNRIESDQYEQFGPLLDIYDEIWLRSELGYYPEDWDYEFNALWALSDNEKADLELKNSQRDKAYYDMGIVTSSLIAENLKQDKVYNISDEYLVTLQEMDEEEKERSNTEIDLNMEEDEINVDNRTKEDDQKTAEKTEDKKR